MAESGNPPREGLSLLAALAHRPEVRDIWFNGKEVTLDGYNFRSCRFDRCELHVSSQHFELHHCFVDDYTKIYYKGDMVKIIRLFTLKYPWFYQNLPYFAPQKHEDGTISITW